MDMNTTWLSAVDQCLQGDTNYSVNVCTISKGIVDHKLSLHEFVILLGKYLTDTNDELRAKGCKLLVDVLHRLPPGAVRTEEASVLAIFLCDRLQDHDSVVTQALHGCVALSNCRTLPKEDAVRLLGALFREIGPNNQSRALNDRQNVYLIFHNLLQFHLEAIKTMSSDFLSGFIQTIDGEKDPRNLVVVFNLVPKIIRNFDIDPFAEDLFEVIGCYFPIDYNPPASDPRAVSREQLIVGLRRCLAATPKFSEYCMPLIMEKIDSDLPSAKIDALLTLAECAEVYGSNQLRAFYVDAWRSIRRELMSASVSPELEKAALSAATCLVRSSGTSVVHRNSKDSFMALIDEILTDCLSNICQPAMRYMLPSAKLLQAAAAASSIACERIANAVIPVLLEQFYLKTELHHRTAILHVMNQFVDECRKAATDGHSPLCAYKVQILNFYTGILNEVVENNVRLGAIDGFLSITLSSLLGPEEVANCIELLAKVAVHDLHQDIRRDSLEAVSKMAVSYPRIVKETLLPHLMEVIKSTKTADTIYENHLQLLASVIMDSSSLVSVTTELLNEMETLLISGGDPQKLCAFSACLGDIATRTCQTMVAYFNTAILLPVIQLVYKHWPLTAAVADGQFLRNITRIYITTLPNLMAKESTLLLQIALKANTHNCSVPIKSPDPRFILIIECILSCSKRETLSLTFTTPKDGMNDLVARIINLVRCDYDDDDLCLTGSRCLASLVNKIADDYVGELVSTLLNTVSYRQWDQNSANLCMKSQTVTLLVWLTKAITMRGHSSMDAFIAEMFAYLNDEDVCEQTANGFQFVLSDTVEALNVVCHAHTLLFYKQRFFVCTSQKLMHRIQTSTGLVNHCHLEALVLQLPLIPKESYIMELPTLIPILIKGMLSKTATLLISILSTISDILKNDATIVTDYVDTILAQLLNLSFFKGAMKVRIMALEILAGLATLPTHIAVRQKQNIIRELTPALDDPKRLVRIAAVQARNNWFLVGSPGGKYIK